MNKKIFIVSAVLSCASAFGFAQAKDDKPRISEFAGEKLPIVLVEGRNQRDMIFDSMSMKDGVPTFKLLYADGTPGAMFVSLNQKGVMFRYKVTPTLNRLRDNYARGNWEDAVSAGRHVIYPAVAIMSVDENITNIQENLGMFVESLIKAKRYVEAKSLMESLPLSKATATVGKVVVDYATAMLKLGRIDDCMSVMERLNFGGENLANIDDMMARVDILRSNGNIKEAVTLYTKLQSTPENPRAKEATLWMAYCDIIRGNTMAAQIFLDTPELKDLKKSDPVFSLKSMIRGILLESDKNVSDALDAYGEGIVYGDTAYSWMPELLFKTAKAYKAIQKPETANEILEQIILLYPNDKFSKLSAPEIVPIEKKESEGDAAVEE